MAGWIALSDGLIDRNGKPLGTDFSNVYAAGTLTWQGRPADAYAPPLQHAAEKAVFGGREVPFYGWHYPPFFFAIAFAVAAFPYAWGLSIWLVASFAAYLAAMRAILPRPETLLIAAAFPAVFVNIGHGQNGFLTAALLGGALQLLDRRPWLAGVLIGCLAYKPQFGVLIPIALSGRRTLEHDRRRGRHHRSAARAQLRDARRRRLARLRRLHDASPRPWCSNRAAPAGRRSSRSFRRCGCGAGASMLAYAVQTALLLTLAATLAWLWQSDAAFELKAAALATASLLATPYVLDYDLVASAVAIAFFARLGLDPRLSQFRDQPVGGRLDRAAVVARHRRRDWHTTGTAGAANALRFHLAARGARSHGSAAHAQSTRAGVI